MATGSHTSVQSAGATRRRRHQSDPFYNDSIIERISPSRETSASSLNNKADQPTSPDGVPAEPDSYFTRFVLNPLHFISFLLSLQLVDRQHRQYRVAESSPTSPPGGLSDWWDPEPYRWLEGPVQQRTGAVASNDREPRPRGAVGAGRWYVHKMHRKVMRMEITQAFQIRGWVMLGLVAAFAMAVAGFCWVVREVWEELMTPWEYILGR